MRPATMKPRQRLQACSRGHKAPDLRPVRPAVRRRRDHLPIPKYQRDTGEGADYLLLTFAATMVRGVYMYGGEDSISGVLIGVLCLASITNAQTIAGVPPSIYQGILDVIVLAVVLIQACIRR
jgi:hypothetical protein